MLEPSGSTHADLPGSNIQGISPQQQAKVQPEAGPSQPPGSACHAQPPDPHASMRMALTLGGLAVASAAAAVGAVAGRPQWRMARRMAAGLPPPFRGICHPRPATAQRPIPPQASHPSVATSSAPVNTSLRQHLPTRPAPHRGLASWAWLPPVVPPGGHAAPLSTSATGAAVRPVMLTPTAAASDSAPLNSSAWRQTPSSANSSGGGGGSWQGWAGWAGSSSGGGGGRWGWSSWASHLLAPAAVAAAAVGAATAAAADAGGSTPAGRGSSSSSSSGGGGGQSPVQALRESLAGTWLEVQQDMQRLNASLPADAPSLVGVEPKVSHRVVGGEEVVEVVIPVRQGCDVRKVLADVREAVKPPPGVYGTFTAERNDHNVGSTTGWDVHLDVKSGGTTTHAQLTVPPAGREGQAEVRVERRAPRGSGPPSFSFKEFQGLAQVVRSANLTRAPDHSGALGWPSSESEVDRRRSGPGSAELDSLLGALVHGGMHAIFEEMQRMMEGMEGDMGSAGSGELPEAEEGGERPLFDLHAGRELRGGRGAEEEWEQGARGRGGRAGGAQGRGEAEGHDWGSAAAAAAVKQLRQLGAQVFPPGSKDSMDWGVLAGYEPQKRLLEDCLLLPLQHPEVYSRVAAATRQHPGSNRPRAVLFEGPPGTGKTTSARVISTQAAVPLVYLPLEAVLSKWYGESEGQLAKVFKAAAALGGAIIFIDELDALGGSRDRGDLHEASRRLLSVLLREMDGFEVAGARAVVVGATNRKADLDPALLSRFDMCITFGLPDQSCRGQILQQYARQLTEEERRQLAAVTPGMSGRDLRDVCEVAERRWASKIIRGEVSEGSLPTLSEYTAAARERLLSIRGAGQQVFGGLAQSRAAL